MYFVGVDLAWGERKPTGVAVLDGGGALVHVGAVRDEEEIAAALRPYLEPACLVAFDAPLIVTNATGNRPAEAALNRDFARFDAGAHPVNTAKPEFSGTPRAARISAVLGLDLAVRSSAPRRAIEVYPHAATVALFGLGRTLKYKNKPGRDLPLLRSELLRLTGLLEGLAVARPALLLDRPGSGWAALVRAVQAAGRKSELRVVEDQVDAVVCAYVALFASRAPERTTIYGDDESGAIVTPSLPAGQVPNTEPAAQPNTEPTAQPNTEPAAQPNTGATTPELLRSAVREYTARQPEIAEAGRRFVELVTALLDEAGINYLSVTGRIKSITSFAAKANRRAEAGPAFPDPLHDITDQIGVRVITYVQSDVIAVADLLHETVQVKDDRDLGQETASEGRFGYASRHLLIAVDPREGQPAREPLRGWLASVQVRTVLQHAWAEFEHDIRYKGTVPSEHAQEFDRRFTLAAGLLELADREFTAIRERLRPAATERAEPVDDEAPHDPRIVPRELAAFLAGQYAEAGWSRTDHYAWISGLLLELGITSIDELSEALRPTADLDLNARMAYRYPPGAVRRLDDALLAAFGARYLALHGNAHRTGLLTSRLDKLLAAASPGIG